MHVEVRRWRQKSNGNTYHTVKLFVKPGESLTSPMTYGYGDAWIITASKLCSAAGIQSLHDLRHSNVTHSVIDVPRLKDLHRQEAQRGQDE